MALVHRFTLHLFAARGAALLAALGFWLFLLATERPAWRRWLASSLACGLALWFVQPVLIVMALLLLWLVAGRLGARVIGAPRDRLAGALLLLAGMLVAITPFFLRNLLFSGEPVPLTAVGGIHLYIGNYARANGAYS